MWSTEEDCNVKDPLPRRIRVTHSLCPPCSPTNSERHCIKAAVSKHTHTHTDRAGNSLHSHISYPTKKSYMGVKREPFPCTWTFCATFTGQKGRKSQQPHPGMLRHGKVLIKQCWQSSVNHLWTFHQAWFSSCIMETWYKGQYLFWAFVNDCLEKIHC